MNIKKIRQAKGYSLKVLSSMVNIPDSMLSRYENGIIDPPISKLKLIADALNVTIDDLISSDDSRNIDYQIGSFTIETQKTSTIDYSNRMLAYASLFAANELEINVKKNADGKCELCGNPAPFNDLSGKPYLEIFDLKKYAIISSIPVNNAVALCPNCHAKLEHAPEKEDIQKLIKVAANHI